MALKDLLGGLWKSLGARSVDDVSLEDLERERNRLRVEEDKIRQEQAELETRERQLLEEGREAKSTAAKKQIAAKIRDVRGRGQTLEQRMTVLSKSMRIAGGLHTIKENETFYKNAGLGGALADIPLERIVAYIERSPEGVETSVEKMADILDSLNEAEKAVGAVIGSGADDAELDDIMSEFDSPAPAEKADDETFEFDAPSKAREAAKGNNAPERLGNDRLP